MWRHVTEQLKNVSGGLGEKMEDWVERQHQDGKRSRDTGELQTFRPGQVPVLTKVTEGAEQTLERRWNWSNLMQVVT